MTSQLPRFADIHFGMLDAAEEAHFEPQLLLDGYYDYRDAAKGIALGNSWLILGPKGSGKSAVLENVRLSWESRLNRSFTTWHLGNFPVNDVTKISTGQSAGGARAQAAWEFLLLIRAIESLDRDSEITTKRPFRKLVEGLKKEGLITSDWLSAVTQWTGGTLSFDAKVFGYEHTLGRSKVTPLDVSGYIRQQMATVETPTRHVIAIDGLDSFFFELEDEWTSLAGLMQAISSLNLQFSRAAIPVMFIAAVRSDILEVLPGPETTKLSTHAVHLDWNAHGIGSRNHLWSLLSKKASATSPGVRNIVNQYLSTPISIGPHTEMAEFLLDHTRLLPRDAIALMQYLQASYNGTKQVTEAAAKRAVQEYSEKYFVSEIFDNLAGILPHGKSRHLQSFKDALRTAPTRFFNFTYVCEELAGELDPQEIKRLLRQMFETGGIGVRNGQYTDFTFRKVSGAGFTVRYEFMLHDALTRAWNRPWR